MFNKKHLLYNPYTYIALLLITTALFVFLHSHYIVLCCDEVLYSYVLDTDVNQGYWRPDGVTQKLTTFDEIISSQINHYQYANGRVLIHGIEQWFTCIIGIDVYYIINAILFTFLIIGVIRLNTNSASRRNFFLWLITIIMLIYCFPEPSKLWYSINFSPNYLLPSLLMTLTYISFKYLNSNISQPLRNIEVCIIILISFIFGASHEGFSATTSLVLFIYYIFHFKSFIKRGWVLCIPLWIGTLAVSLAPGNFGRVDGVSWGHLSVFENVYYFIILNVAERYPLLDSYILLLITKIAHQISFREFYNKNRFFIFAGVISFTVLLTTHRNGHVFTPVDLIIVYLIISLLSDTHWFQRNTFYQIIIGLLITSMYTISQVSICLDAKRVGSSQQNIVNEYVESTDSIICYNPPIVNWYNKPFVSLWDNNGNFNTDIVKVSYGNRIKPIFVINPTEAKFLNAPESYRLNVKKIPGNAGFVNCGTQYLWANADSIPNGSQIQLEYMPLSFKTNTILPLRIKFALFGDSYPSSEIVKVDTFKYSTHTFYRLIPPGVRTVKSISFIK